MKIILGNSEIIQALREYVEKRGMSLSTIDYRRLPSGEIEYTLGVDVVSKGSAKWVKKSGG